ncbi:MAG: hypothetical protein Q9160_001603 [Pyrenula sp. 1 TL-2023]
MKQGGVFSYFQRLEDENSLDPFIPVDRLMLDGRQSGGYNLITCLPSSGGILTANKVHPVMLDHLGLDRMHDVPRPSSQSEEDILCIRMRSIGAEYFDNQHDLEFAWYHRRRLAPKTWWLNEYSSGDLNEDLYEAFMKSKTKEEIRLVMKGPVPIVHCWPETGGVWVRPTYEWGEDAVDQGLMRKARTMEELCRAVEKSGGEFYEDPKDCDWTKDMLSDLSLIELSVVHTWSLYNSSRLCCSIRGC